MLLMSIRFPRWILRAIDYEKGFLTLVWNDIRERKAVFAKALALLGTLALTLTGLAGDFGADADSYGVKAAICALGAASIVFIGMVSTTGQANPRFDPLVRAVGGLFALLAGVFWLLAETDGKMQPYLWAVATNGAVMFCVMVLVALLGLTNRWESILQRLRRDGRSDPRGADQNP